MNLKEFFKPEINKIVLTILAFVLVGFYLGLVCWPELGCSDPLFLTTILAFPLFLGNWIFVWIFGYSYVEYSYVVWVLEFAYLYVISCFIMYLYKYGKTRVSGQNGGNKK